jgi:HEAT repeat protein
VEKFLARVGVGRVSTLQLLIDSLRDKNAKTSRAALAGLANLRLSAQSVLPLLTAASHDTEAEVRRGAAVALGSLGKQGTSSAVPLLVKLLRDKESWHVRREAADALGAIGPDAKAAAPALKESLQDWSATVRKNASAALGKIIPDSKD